MVIYETLSSQERRELSYGQNRVSKFFIIEKL